MDNTGYLYWNVFAVTFAAVAVWETAHPHAPLRSSSLKRWGAHGALLVLSNTLAVTVCRTTPVFVATAAERSSFGLLHLIDTPWLAAAALTVLLLDLLRYAQHYLFHRLDLLWRFHAIHHADEDYDLTTGLRFHPIETLLTYSSYLAAVAVLGAPPAAVLAVELATVCQNLFAHANTSLPAAIRNALAHVWITPDVHRVHHAPDALSQTSNFGTMFPWWDRVFGTYRSVPREPAPPASLTPGSLNVPRLVLRPFLPVRSIRQSEQERS